MQNEDLQWESKADGIGASAGNDDNNKVQVGRNRIYFYSEVNRPKNLELNKTLVTMANTLYNRGQSLDVDPGRIFLHINSGECCRSSPRNAQTLFHAHPSNIFSNVGKI